MEGIIQFTDKFNLFTEEINTGSINLKYYGDLERTNEDGCVEIEVEKTVSETMDRFFDVENLVVSLKGKNASLEEVDGELWLAYSDEDETFKINMTKMPMGLLDVAYEKTTSLLRDGKNNMNFTVGLALEARVDMDFMEPVQEVCMEKIVEKSLEEIEVDGTRKRNEYAISGEDVKEFFYVVGTFALTAFLYAMGNGVPILPVAFP